ncbi:TolC family protein [bacterium]|nr:TolC family protein [bacterium]
MTPRPCLALLLVGLAGCAGYSPAPLDDPFLQETLAAPRFDALRADSLALLNPRLAPLRFDPSDGLSPDEAAVAAVIANPELRALRTARGVGQASVFAAGLLPDPQLAASADFPVHDRTGALTATGLGLSLDLNAFFTRRAERASAQADLAQTELDIAWQEWQVAQSARLEVRRAALLAEQVLVARRVAEAQAEGFERVQQATERRLATRVESAARADALLAARSARRDLEGQLAESRASLNRLLGLPPGSAVTLQSDSTAFAGTVAPSPDATGDSLLAQVQARRLDLIALRRGYASQEEALRAAVLRRFPRINIGVNRLRNDAGLLTLGPAISIDLPVFDGGRGEQAAALASREQLRQEYAARVFALRAEVAALVDARDRTRAELADAEASLHELEATAEAMARARERNAADVLAVDDAESSLAGRRLEVLQLRRNLIELAVALETASGGVIPARVSEERP